ncbi:MAG: dTDP-4-dehydrorhamnose reductase [Pseudomonadota bacterium]
MPPPPRILLIGAHGQAGWELQRTLAVLGDVIPASDEGEYPFRVDLTRPDSIRQVFDRSAPSLVINAAAYTAVDKAETDHDTARRVNADALEIIGQLAARRGAWVVHYSTDFIFNGTTTTPYREEDPPNPINYYGVSKLDGERALIESGARHLIFRTSWLYGTRGNNFFLTMLRLMRERDELRVVADQIGAPTWSRLLAEVTAQVVAKTCCQADPQDSAALQGVYHLTCAGQTSWHGFAKAIQEECGESTRILAITSKDYPSLAQRPPYSVLDNSKLKKTFGLCLPDWRLALSLCYRDLR